MNGAVTDKKVTAFAEKNPKLVERFRNQKPERVAYEFGLIKESKDELERKYMDLEEEHRGLKESYENIFEEFNEAVSKKSELEEEKSELKEEKSELEERLKEFLDRDAQKRKEEKEKEDKRKAREEYNKRTDKKVYAVEPFLNKADFELFMSRLKEKYYEVYILGVVLFSNALRYSDGIKLKFKAIKRLVETLDLNESVALPTNDQKTRNDNTISFRNERDRRTLKEYFMKVEKTGIEIDEKTPLMINLRLKKPLKKKMINEYLMRVLNELHEEKKLLHTVRVGTHSFRKTFVRLALLDKKNDPHDVRRKLRHSTLEQTYRYAHFSIEEVNRAVNIDVNI